VKVPTPVGARATDQTPDQSTGSAIHAVDQPIMGEWSSLETSAYISAGKAGEEGDLPFQRVREQVGS
jgi:hypothetical protein